MTPFDPRVTPVRAGLAAEHLRGKVEAARFAAGRRMRVAAPSAPLRRAPDTNAALDTEALRGEAVTVYDTVDGWVWGQLAADGYVGYLPEASLAAEAPAPTHRVTTLRTFVYPGPSIKLPPAEVLSLGSAVCVEAEEGTFSRLPDGGHVWSGHLAPPGVQAPDFVAVAERFAHTPYLWGGKTSTGLDCSGLTQLALAAAGIPAPRDSDMQEKALGTPLAVTGDLAGFRRGDLVFWKGHVGIMSDAVTLLHADGHQMLVMAEPLAQARDRILKNSFGAITSVRRLA